MELGLSMVVKNEENRLHRCLADKLDLFTDVCILDTGSSDNTINILKNSFGIQPIPYTYEKQDTFRLLEPRNLSIKLNKAKWILVLDADEYISREDIVELINYTPKADDSGFFMKRLDFRYEKPFEDYKLFILKGDEDLCFEGGVHACPQVNLRRKGKKASWIPNVTIEHHQDPSQNERRKAYFDQMYYGIATNPNRVRYYWFLGYAYRMNGNLEEGIKNLKIITDSQSLLFPVECINAYMVLVETFSHLKNPVEAKKYLIEGYNFFKQVEDDFEVQINFRMKSWFQDTIKAFESEKMPLVQAYKFAF